MALHAERPVRALRPSAPMVGPWTRRQCVVLAALHVVVLLVILGSYWMASGEAHSATQLAWLNVSVLGLVLACVADALFFTRGHRTVSRLRGRVFVPATAAAARAPLASEVFVSLEGARRFHLADCAMVAGKAVSVALRPQHVADGRVPCEVCLVGAGE